LKAKLLRAFDQRPDLLLAMLVSTLDVPGRRSVEKNLISTPHAGVRGTVSHAKLFLRLP
jgi:hypothetical protein